MTVIRTAVQHGDRLIRVGLSHLLDGEPDVEVVGGAADLAELHAICAESEPDVALIELDAPDGSSAHVVAALRQHQRTIRVVGMHGGLSAAESDRLHRAGVRHTVSYDMGAGSIVAVLRGRHLAPGVTGIRGPSGSDHPAPLTTREREVLRLVAGGRRSKEIATELRISIATVENHKQRLFRKLDVQNQAHAVSVAVRRGLLTFPVAHA